MGLLNNVTITSKPVSLPSGWGTSNYIGSTQWGFQDIATPGETTGDGVADNGNMPLRMVIAPQNTSTHIVRARDFYLMSPGWNWGSGEYNSPDTFTFTSENVVDLMNVWGDGTNSSPAAMISVDSLDSVSSFLYDTYMLDQTTQTDLYPGWPSGVSVNAKVFESGASISMMDDDCSYATVDFNDNGLIYDKVIIYDWDFENDTFGTEGSATNSVVVLVYLKPEHELATITNPSVDLTGAGYASLLNYEIKLFGSAIPITEYNDYTSQISLATGSFVFQLESDNAGAENIGYDIKAQSLFGMFSNGMYNYYEYLATRLSGNWTGMTSQVTGAPPPSSASFSQPNFTYDGFAFFATTPENFEQYGGLGGGGNAFGMWTESSTALGPNLQWMSDNYIQPALFWFVPRDGYVVSRHNFSIETVSTGTTTYHSNPYDETITYTGNSKRAAGWNQFIGPSSVFGQYINQSGTYTAELTQAQIDSMMQIPGSFQALSTSPYELPQNEIPVDGDGNTYQMWSWRGVTKYKDVKAYTMTDVGVESETSLAAILSNDPSQSIAYEQGDLDTVDIMLVDTKSYTQGLPVFNQFINSVNVTWDDHEEFAKGDHGAEWINNEMPADYCPSDWIGNSVLVIIRNLAAYIPGVDPPNIKIKIQGKATALDGSECANFNIQLSTSEESSVIPTLNPWEYV